MADDAPTPPEEGPGLLPGALTAGEVRSRAASGAALLGARAALIYVFGIGANLLLARLLVPRDFGLVALGTAVVVLGSYLTDGGLGAALIRRESAPARRELEAVLGVQVGLLAAVTVGAGVAGALIGRDGLVVALMVASLPIASLRAPTVVVLERRLRYRVIATADVLEALTYYLWATVTVAAGLGVWGMASAVVVRAFVGTGVVVARGPLGLVRPRWDWRLVRPILGFGVKFQASAAVLILREQGLNVLVAAVGGLATLGVWNLAWRVLQVPNLIFGNVGRVAFPAMSRLLGAGEDPRPVLERGVAVLEVVTGVIVVGIVGVSRALPAIVGERWSEVPAVLLWSGVALVIAAPLVVSAGGYLYAAGHAGIVALAALVGAAAWFGLTAALLPAYGAPAVGLAWIANAVINSGILARRTTKLTGAGVIAGAIPPAVVSLLALAAGWLAGHEPADRLAGGLLGLVVAEAVLLAGIAVVNRRGARDAASLFRRAIGTLRRGAGDPAVGVGTPP